MSEEIAVSMKIFETGEIWSSWIQTELSLSFSIWRKKKKEKAKRKRRKKAEQRGHKEFPKCGRDRKRNLGYYKEISIHSEEVKWAKVL